MKTANEYKELTNNKSLLYIIKYENEHPIIMKKIENAIMEGVEHSQYIIGLEMSMLSAYDVKMIQKVLTYYGFKVDWHVSSNNDDESCQSGTLTIHWA